VAATSAPEWLGRRVVGDINLACGQCPTCQAGRPHHCENRSVLGILGKDGAFAEYLTLPLRNLWEVPASVPDEMAVFTEPLAAALEIQEQVQIAPGMRVLVVGAGRLGQLVAQTMALTGCDLKVVVRNERARLVLSERGIKTIQPGEIIKGMADLVVEATGVPEGFDLARTAVRPAGTLVMKSTYAGTVNLNLSSLVVDEIQLIGSRCGPFGTALRLLEQRQVDPTYLIDARYPLEQAVAAFSNAAQPGVWKVLLSPVPIDPIKV
jgi:threonine dehydrogenase-like Zn-dependent dehydrogenase